VGGRYDNLIGLFAKDSLSGVGFGMGDVTMRDFLETHRLLPEFKHPVDVFVSLPSAALLPKSEEVASALRAAGFKVVTPLAEGGFGAQLKLATKHGARFAVLFGDDEIKRGEVVLKDLDSGLQTTPKISEVATKIQEVL
jgi:histidyl-tRNA synthetase